MLDEGTRSLTTLEISDRLEMLGAHLSTGSGLDTSSVYLSALKDNLTPSLDLYSEVVLHPSFPAAELDRLKKNQLDGIQREKVQPNSMALRVLPQLLYGAGHAYANPLTGSGTEASVKGIGRADVQNFYDTWFKPNHGTIVVVGDTTLDEIRPRLEKLFAEWQSGDIPQKNIAKAQEASKSAVYLLDRPGSLQSLILAGNLTVPMDNPEEVAIESMNEVLGGQFTSRLNMNLREDKHWSYGVSTLIFGARGQRPFIAYAPVQTDKTKESMAEIVKEFEGVLKAHPLTAEELGKTKKQQVLELAGKWETMGAVSGSIDEIVRYGLPDDYFNTYTEKVKALDLPKLQQAAETVLHPDRMVWVVVGDLAKIEPGIRELNLGEIRYIDADGKAIQHEGATGGN
jgi:zinc protease